MIAELKEKIHQVTMEKAELGDELWDMCGAASSDDVLEMKEKLRQSTQDHADAQVLLASEILVSGVNCLTWAHSLGIIRKCSSE